MNPSPQPIATTEPLLDIQGLSVVFETDDGRVQAVDEVSLRIQRGEILGLVGESGCGKSVAAMSIPRLIPSPPGRRTAGRIDFDGQDLATLPIAKLRRLRGNRIGVIFQDPMSALSPLHRIGRQMVEALRLHRPLNRQAARDIALQWLHKTGIPNPQDNIDAYPFQLSGGMRQRVVIAMALVCNPEILIADEPTTALDVTIQAQIMGLMKGLQRDLHTSILLITHDLGVVAQLADDVAVMYLGRIVERGDVRSIIKQPRHPYTIGLLKSLPSLAAAKDRLPSITGSVPSLTAIPPGCPFHPRCPYAEPGRCDLGGPPPTEAIAELHQVACLRVHEIGGAA